MPRRPPTPALLASSAGRSSEWARNPYYILVVIYIESQRVGFASVLLLLGVGVALMFFVKEERTEPAAALRR